MLLGRSRPTWVGVVVVAHVSFQSDNCFFLVSSAAVEAEKVAGDMTVQEVG